MTLAIELDASRTQLLSILKVSGEGEGEGEADRRKAHRYRCEGTAEVVVLSGALRFVAHLRDLSTTGCCLKTDRLFSLERGTQVELVMSVDGVHFRVLGGIRSNDPLRGIGLEFMNPLPRTASYIRDLVAEMERKSCSDDEDCR